MGMGGLVKPSEKAKEQEGESTAPGKEVDNMTRVVSKTAMPSWINFGRSAAGEASTQRQRKKSVAEVQEEEDDRHIRFTIGGVGQRMTKENFIKQVQQLDHSMRRDTIDKSSASHAAKTPAKQDTPVPDIVVSRPGKSIAEQSSAIGGRRRHVTGIDGKGENGSDGGSGDRSPSSRTERTAAGPSEGIDDAPETAVERRRRLAVLQSVSDDDDDDDDSDDGNDETRETPAERRRREAALGMSSQQAEDSDDDDTPRVPPARRGIRFADVPERRR